MGFGIDSFRWSSAFNVSKHPLFVKLLDYQLTVIVIAMYYLTMEQPVTSPAEALEAQLARLQTELNAADRRAASLLGVGSAEDLQVLRMLLSDGPQRVGVLARARGSSAATISARLDRLERRGLLTRDRIPGDRRSVAASLTSAGRSAAAASRAERLEALGRLEQLPKPRRLDQVIAALAVDPTPQPPTSSDHIPPS
jgi:DNA-binding MarR family transcriptional regulator